MDKAKDLTKETSVCCELHKESPLWHQKLTVRIYGIHNIRVFNYLQKEKNVPTVDANYQYAYPLIKYK